MSWQQELKVEIVKIGTRNSAGGSRGERGYHHIRLLCNFTFQPSVCATLIKIKHMHDKAKQTQWPVLAAPIVKLSLLIIKTITRHANDYELFLL